MRNTITYATFTNIGSRPVNEDSFGVFEKDGNTCFILCDGLGGHGMGDVASKFVVDFMGSAFMHDAFSGKFISDAMLSAQLSLLEEQKHLNAGNKMKTTATILIADKKNAYIGHIGDSRVYTFSKGKAPVRTLDHSVPQMLVMTHEIEESEIRHHPDRSTLLRVMGTAWDDPKYEIQAPVSLRKCQAFLLCSDGFWELIEDDEMQTTLNESSSVEEWMEKMSAIVSERGNGIDMDNNTAIAVWVKTEGGLFGAKL